jgi:hypothetical protein
VSSSWLTGIGLVLNMAGVVLLFYFGVPRYRRVEEANQGFLQLEEDDPSALARTTRADRMSKLAMLLLCVGVVLQLIALL